MRKTLSTISTYCLIAVIMLAALAGCGRKGGLYLPENVKQDNKTSESAATQNTDDAGN
ncbi:MAG: lipoprotein [Gammaproteobacteria bacterium]|jgi:predicted small lipoprotein YifL|nr:lipoprotein [Gammaproteobacteria bacterium]